MICEHWEGLRFPRQILGSTEMLSILMKTDFTVNQLTPVCFLFTQNSRRCGLLWPHKKIKEKEKRKRESLRYTVPPTPEHNSSLARLPVSLCKTAHKCLRFKNSIERKISEFAYYTMKIALFIFFWRHIIRKIKFVELRFLLKRQILWHLGGHHHFLHLWALYYRES